MSVTTFTSTGTFIPWVSGESLAPSNMNRHLSAVTFTLVVTDSVSTVITSSNTSMVPISPIMGTGQISAATKSAPIVQFYNPANSTVSCWVFELTTSLVSGVGPIVIRRSSSTLTAHSTASIFTSPTQHLEQGNSSTITAVLRSYDSIVGSVFTRSGGQWFGKPGTDGQAGWQPTNVRIPGSYPWIVKPGSAIEVVSETTGPQETIKATFVWDER
jgi:hypothetical protein